MLADDYGLDDVDDFGDFENEQFVQQFPEENAGDGSDGDDGDLPDEGLGADAVLDGGDVSLESIMAQLEESGFVDHLLPRRVENGGGDAFVTDAENEAENRTEEDASGELEENDAQSLGNAPEDAAENEQQEGEIDEHPSGELDAFGRYMEKNRTAWKHRKLQYGISYNMMSGEPVNSKSEQPSRVVNAGGAKYCSVLYEDEVEFMDVFAVADVKGIQYGETFQGLGDMVLVMDDEDLHKLTTFDVQSTLCAAFNSGRKLNWFFGVDVFNKVTGCMLTRDERDVIRQAFDFAIGCEFVPALDPNMAKLSMIPVISDDGDGTTMRVLVQITAENTSNALYQLSSGRVYYINETEVVSSFGSLDEARLKLIGKSAVSTNAVELHETNCTREDEKSIVKKECVGKETTFGLPTLTTCTFATGVAAVGAVFIGSRLLKN